MHLLTLPSRDWQPDPVPASNPLPALALILSVLGCWVFWTVGYLSGRSAERGSQLGQVLALAPQRDSLEAALAWVRRLGWPPKSPLGPRQPATLSRAKPLRTPALPRWEAPPTLLAAPPDTTPKR